MLLVFKYILIPLQNLLILPPLPPLLTQSLFLLQSDLNIVASFDRRGKHIYTGNAKGRVSDEIFNNVLLKKKKESFSLTHL